MAAASDKARFYLEQYVPELQEYERKEIFSTEEIRSIAAKRSDCEHILNARGSKPADYARYATYEMNLDSLRKKRCKRLGVKSTTFSGQRTVFFILDRATRKFPGDTGLWMQYIQFCQRERANRKLAKVFTSVLRLKPRDYGLWVLAAKHYAEIQGDMRTARAYVQRGLRFCKDEKKLWLEYARLEMVYLAKLAARRKILGLGEGGREGLVEEVEKDDEDVIMLPTIAAEELESEASRSGEEVDASTLQALASTPALNGGIPIAIFDAAMKQFSNDLTIALDIFDIIAEFDQVPSTRRISQHILIHLQTFAPNSGESTICSARLTLFGVDPHTADFPQALSQTFTIVKKGLTSLSSRSQANIAEKAVLMLLPYLKLKAELDGDVGVVLVAGVRKYLRVITQAETSKGEKAVALLMERLKKYGREEDAEMLKEYSQGLQDQSLT